MDAITNQVMACGVDMQQVEALTEGNTGGGMDESDRLDEAMGGLTLEPLRATLGSTLAPASSPTHDSQRQVLEWYDRKTASILKKYGPGPRVHFHIGLFSGQHLRPSHDMESLRQRLVASQEALMERAAKVWDATTALSGDVLDAGCGLGGGSIYWAQEYGAHVTAVTIVPEHIPLIARFAEEAGVANRIRPLVSDAAKVKGERCFDAAVAMESACYFDRPQWFTRLSSLLRPGGYVCVEDTFLGKPEWAAPFDRYWRTRVAPVSEYIEAAEAAGFTLDRNEDITDETSDFWIHSQAWSRAAMSQQALIESEINRMPISINWHAKFYRAWKEHGIEVRLLRFRLKS